MNHDEQTTSYNPAVADNGSCYMAHSLSLLTSVRLRRIVERGSLVLPLFALTASTFLPAGKIAFAQAPNKAQAPTAAGKSTANQPAPRTRNVNVLILALDDLSDMDRIRALLPVQTAPASMPSSEVPSVENVPIPNTAPATPTPALPELTPPAAPAAPDAMAPQPANPNEQPPVAIQPAAPTLPAITPATLPQLPGAIYYSVAAKRDPKVDKDADLFRLEPDFSKAYPRKTDKDKTRERADDTTGITALPTGPGSGTNATDTTSRSTDLGPSSPFLIAGGENAEPAPGPARMAAAPLRRALLASGFNDVLSTYGQGTAIVRALNSRRLSQRVLNVLTSSTAAILNQTLNNPESAENASSDSSANQAPAKPAIQAAARVGQALGYRSVIVLAVVPTAPASEPTTGGQGQAAADPATRPQSATYAMLVVDAMSETGETMVFDEKGPDTLLRNESAAATGAAVVARAVDGWREISAADRAQRVTEYMTAARNALAQGDNNEVRDLVNQVLAFDPNRVEAHLLLGDALAKDDSSAAVASYRKAAELNASDGETWAKVAIAYTTGTTPDWPKALEAGRKALALNYDSSSLRQAMATAQLGRADLFRRADRINSAEEAEADAQQHLNRALQLAPEDPAVTRLITRQLVSQGRYRDAVRTLDRIAVQYPNDPEIQTQYATVLLQLGGRDEDAFVAWARVWRLTGQQAVPLDTSRYRRLTEGFDQRAASLGKQSAQLTAAVAANQMPREAALLQLTRFQEDISAADSAIKVMQPPADRAGGAAHASRIFASDLIAQSIAAQRDYLETGQEIYRNRGNELYRQAINGLNAARGARG